MGIIRANQLPDGSGNLTNDDVFVFMDDPSGSGITKKISLSKIGEVVLLNGLSAGSGINYSATPQVTTTSGSELISSVSISDPFDPYNLELTAQVVSNLGSGTNFLSTVEPGDILLNGTDDSEIGTVASVENDTNLTLTSPPNFAFSAIPWKIRRSTPAGQISAQFSGSYNDLTDKPTIGIPSNTGLVPNSTSITNIVRISQANYDAIVTKDASTLYIIS